MVAVSANMFDSVQLATFVRGCCADAALVTTSVATTNARVTTEAGRGRTVSMRTPLMLGSARTVGCDGRWSTGGGSRYTRRPRIRLESLNGEIDAAKWFASPQNDDESPSPKPY